MQGGVVTRGSGFGHDGEWFEVMRVRDLSHGGGGGSVHTT